MSYSGIRLAKAVSRNRAQGRRCRVETGASLIPTAVGFYGSLGWKESRGSRAAAVAEVAELMREALTGDLHLLDR
jgi:hypothetical protein